MTHLFQQIPMLLSHSPSEASTYFSSVMNIQEQGKHIFLISPWKYNIRYRDTVQTYGMLYPQIPQPPIRKKKWKQCVSFILTSFYSDPVCYLERRKDWEEDIVRKRSCEWLVFNDNLCLFSISHSQRLKVYFCCLIWYLWFICALFRCL